MPRPDTTLSFSGDGWAVSVVTSNMLQTNCTVLVVGDDALVIDAPYFPDELLSLPRVVRDTGGSFIRLFATHSHFDHLLGRLAFPHVPLVVGAPTAAALAADPGRPVRELAEEDARHYVHRRDPLVYAAMEGTAVPGYLEMGDRDVDLEAADGHTGDGTALWAEFAGLLCPGDYLSDVELPLISHAGSLSSYRATLERLAPLVSEARLVVPGHGRPAPAAEGLRRLEEDGRYLDLLAVGDPDAPLPRGRDSVRQREIHRANLERMGPPA